MSEVVDANGRVLEVGLRVQVGDVFGTVRQISDADGDMDDGRMVGYDPVVDVEYDNGEHESFPAPWWEHAPYRCDDIVLVPAYVTGRWHGWP